MSADQPVPHASSSAGLGGRAGRDEQRQTTYFIVSA
jgi:hypothetical protein